MSQYFIDNKGDYTSAKECVTSLTALGYSVVNNSSLTNLERHVKIVEIQKVIRFLEAGDQ